MRASRRARAARDAGHGEYYCLLLFSILGMAVLVSSQNLISLFLGIELLLQLSLKERPEGLRHETSKRRDSLFPQNFHSCGRVVSTRGRAVYSRILDFRIFDFGFERRPGAANPRSRTEVLKSPRP